MMQFLKSLRCDHVWRFAGTGLRAALIPEWIFRCKECNKSKWAAQGVFPDKESYLFYREKMKDDFKISWMYVVSDSFSRGVVISKEE